MVKPARSSRMVGHYYIGYRRQKERRAREKEIEVQAGEWADFPVVARLQSA